MQRLSFTSGGHGGGSGDEGDNRSRNAKAQRRHREKRKAHLKALEETVQILTAQLEDARRQLGAAAYASSSRLGYSPGSKDAQLASENLYLRDENADLRRQLYSLRMNYNGDEQGSGNPGGSGASSGAGGTASVVPPQPPNQRNTPPFWTTEVKHESSGGAGPIYGSYGTGGPGAVAISPRVSSSGHGRNLSHSGGVEIVGQESGSVSSASSYPPPLDHFGNVVTDEKWSQSVSRQPPTRGSTSSSSRGRILSSSSAPSASPYSSTTQFPTDPRAHSLSAPQQQQYSVRYESAVYPQAPPPHSLPRSAMAGGGNYLANPVTYVARPDGDMAWGSDSAPPPFSGTEPNYAMGFAHDQHDGWRTTHH